VSLQLHLTRHIIVTYITIQGLHNVFVVVPQFLVNGLSAIMFAIFDPIQAPKAGVMPPPLSVPSSLVNTGTNATNTSGERSVRMAVKLMRDVGAVVRNLETDRAAEAAEMNERGGQSNSVVYIFR
jgi:solute carrier family 45, member 1/2/4